MASDGYASRLEVKRKFIAKSVIHCSESRARLVEYRIGIGLNKNKPEKGKIANLISQWGFCRKFRAKGNCEHCREGGTSQEIYMQREMDPSVYGVGRSVTHSLPERQGCQL